MWEEAPGGEGGSATGGDGVEERGAEDLTHSPIGIVVGYGAGQGGLGVASGGRRNRVSGEGESPQGGVARSGVALLCVTLGGRDGSLVGGGSRIVCSITGLTPC